MGSSKNAWLLLRKMCTRKLHSFINPSALQKTSGPGSKSWRASLNEELKSCHPEKNESVCIYRVPFNLKEVEPRAYNPNIISIGPYHHGALENMESFKKKFVHRLFCLKHCADPEIKLEPVIDALEALEQEARSHYYDEVKLSRDEFVKMMLIDGCFIVEFLRELEKHNFTHESPLIERWMLPILRRDLIMLENLLPLSVLEKLFQLTSSRWRESNTSLQQLALRFFTPLLQRDWTGTLGHGKENTCSKRKHFLDLFRCSILPRIATEAETSTEKELTNLEKSSTNAGSGTIEGKSTGTIRSMKELRKAGIIIEKRKNFRPLDVHSEGRALIIPPIYIDDYRGTVFRNMVAFEQRHHACQPQVTAYLFFLDGLINSVEDVEELHLEEIMQHSLGSNRDVARLVNNICKEVSECTKGSYLQKVLMDINSYMDTTFATIGAPVVHQYFGSSKAAISTILALLAFCFSIVCNYYMGGYMNGDAQESMAKDNYQTYLREDSFSA